MQFDLLFAIAAIANGRADEIGGEEMPYQIRQGLANHEFILHYQPIFDLSTMEIAGYEALMRWNHPDGMRYPNSFIAQAEKEPDTIFSIFKFAIAQSLIDWERLGDDKFLSINLSATSLEHPELTSVLKRNKHELINLEITERVAIDAEKHLNTLRTISDMDWLIVAIDDFGCASIVQMLEVLDIFGASRLKVKLDMFFMQNLHKPLMPKTIQTIVKLIHDYGVKVVCEGVETQEQLDFLRSIGCDFGQGFLLGKPKAI